jgi:hypothetical protein
MRPHHSKFLPTHTPFLITSKYFAVSLVGSASRPLADAATFHRVTPVASINSRRWPMRVLRLGVKHMTFLAAVHKDFARNLCVVHAILFHTLNLAVPKPLDSLSAISSLFRAKSGLHDIVEFQPRNLRVNSPTASLRPSRNNARQRT